MHVVQGNAVVRRLNLVVAAKVCVLGIEPLLLQLQSRFFTLHASECPQESHETLKRQVVPRLCLESSPVQPIDFVHPSSPPCMEGVSSALSAPNSPDLTAWQAYHIAAWQPWWYLGAGAAVFAAHICTALGPSKAVGTAAPSSFFRGRWLLPPSQLFLVEVDRVCSQGVSIVIPAEGQRPFEEPLNSPVFLLRIRPRCFPVQKCILGQQDGVAVDVVSLCWIKGEGLLESSLCPGKERPVIVWQTTLLFTHT
mmetsp:Transcript_5356/g.13713  ORF Transcript_5356/g.13713 Transcript_5356/m.13713 type:complete len:252 (+) Transcript_5356:326-1081(+)